MKEDAVDAASTILPSFADVQKLPTSQRPRALRSLLRALTGQEIGALLYDAARLRLHIRAGGQQQEEQRQLLAAVVRCAPELPGFSNVSLAELLLHPLGRHPESGLDCPLGMLLLSSPSADEAVAAYFRNGGEILCKLFEWALRSPSSPALLQRVCESVSRLDRAQLELGSSEPKSSPCVVDALVNVCCKPRWTSMEAALLSSSLAKLRDASLRELQMRHDVCIARDLLMPTTRRPCAAENKRARQQHEETEDESRLDCDHCHSHLVHGIVEGLGGEWRPESRKASFFQDVVDGMSLPQISASLDLLQTAGDESTGGMCELGESAGFCAQSGLASLRLFARAAKLILASETPGEVTGSGDKVGDSPCLQLQRKCLNSVDTALETLLHTAMSNGYLSVPLAKASTKVRCPGSAQPPSVMTLNDAVGFLQACAAIGLLSSYGGCMAGDSSSSDHALRSIRRVLAMNGEGENEGRRCRDEGVGEPAEARDLGNGNVAAGNLAMQIGDLQAIGSVLLLILSIQEQGAPVQNSQKAAAEGVLPSCKSATRANCDIREEELVAGTSKARLVKVVLELLSAGARLGKVGGQTSQHTHGLRSELTEQDLAEALPVLVQIVACMSDNHDANCAKAQEHPRIGAAHQDAKRLLEVGVMACLVTAFRLMPSCVARASSQSAIGGYLCSYISSFMQEETASVDEGGQAMPRTLDERLSAPCRTRMSAEGLGRSLVAMNCLIAAQLADGRLDPDAAMADDCQDVRGGCRQDVAPTLFLEICRVFCRIALRLSEAQPCARVSKTSRQSDEDEHSICGLFDCIPSASWRHSYFCKGVGGMGLLLATVVKGRDQNQAGAWLAAALGQTPEDWAHDSRFQAVALPASVLVQATRDMQQECQGRMLRMLAAVCRCAALAEVWSETTVFKAIFLKGSPHGKGVFIQYYSPVSSPTAAPITVPSESLQGDRQLIWQALSSCVRHFELSPAGVSCLNPVLAAIAGATLTGNTEDKLAPLLQACVLRMLLKGARSKIKKERPNALLAMSELVGIGGASPGIFNQPRRSGELWKLVEDEVIGPSSSLEPSADLLHEVLAACRAQIDDGMETVWSGFTFVMALLMEDSCPRIHALVAARNGNNRENKNAEPTLQVKVADFINCWALRLHRNGQTKFSQDISDIESESYRMVSSLLRISQTERLAELLARLGTFGTLWDIFDSQPLEWLQGGEGCGAADSECVLFQFLACMLQSRASIGNFVSHVGGMSAATDRVRRFIVQSSSTGGNVWLNRERRDRLCAFVERLQQARLFANKA